MKGEILNRRRGNKFCGRKPSRSCMSTSKTRAEARDFTGKSEGQRFRASEFAVSSARRMTPLPIFRLRSIVHLYVAWEIPLRPDQVAASATSLNWARDFFRKKKHGPFPGNFNGSPFQSHSWLMLATDRSNFICDFCCRTCNTRWSRFRYISPLIDNANFSVHGKTG